MWLLLLFVMPLYVVLAIVFGGDRPDLPDAGAGLEPGRSGTPRSSPTCSATSFGADGYFGPALLRTAVYVLSASTLCLLIAYPVAYYAARLAGRHRGLLLALLIAPFWISYMMRMLAWVNLLQDDGLVNDTLRRWVSAGSPSTGWTGAASSSCSGWSTATCPT